MILRLITAWLCNLFDIVSTLYFYTYFDGDELNPISEVLLQNPPLFVIFKLAVMTIATVFIWIKRDWNICKVAGWILFIEYMFVAIYYAILYAIV